MTAQFPENLIIDDTTEAMCTEPLEQYFDLTGKRPEFFSVSTACWRGYIGTWRITDERLYLIEIKGKVINQGPVTLNDLFPGYPTMVFAHWFNGVIRVPKGRRLEYVHMGYASRFEYDLLVSIRKGVVHSRSLRDNGKAAEGSPEGYGPAGFSVLT
jgi:hypothetical protein